MSQQNIDFGTFPDDPSADAIRTAFQKVQENFDEVYAATANAAVLSINRTAGRGITVNSPTGNVVVEANVASISISSVTLRIGTTPNPVTTSALYTNFSQTLYIEVPSTLSITNLIASGNISAGGNITSNNANLGNAVVANYFIGDGNQLSNVTAILANVANVAGTVSQNAQPNITSLGTLTSLTVSGNIIAGNIYANTGIIGAQYLKGDGSNLTNLSIPGANVIGQVANALVAGTVYTNAQPNITSTGILTSVSVSGNSNIGNVGTGIITATGTITGGNLSTTGILSVSGNTTLANLSVTGTLTAGDITVGSISNGTSIVDIVGVSGNVTTSVAGVANVLVITTTGANIEGTLSVSGNINAGNVTATTFIGSLNGVATSATTAGTVTTNAQPNITSLGTLSSVTVNGTANLGAIGNVKISGNSGFLQSDGNGNLSFSSVITQNIPGTANTVLLSDGANSIIATGNIKFNDPQLDITGTLSVSGNVNVGNISATNIVGTLTTNAQPNITSVGTLSSLALSGNLNSDSNIVLNNVNANISTLGNMTANVYFGNGSQLTGVTATTAGTVTTNSQPNITSVGTLTGLVVGGDITPNANITYSLGNNTNRFNNLYLSGNTIILGEQTISANATSINISGNLSGDASGLSNITGANVTGTVANATTAGTVTGNAQSNITSVGTLTALTVSGNTSLGAVGNVAITGGTSGQVLSTDGTGNLSFISISSSALTNGNSNVTVLANSDITLSSAGNANVLVVTGVGANVTGTLGVSGNVTAPNFIGNVVGNISGNITIPGSNTGVVFNDAGTANTSTAFTFDKTSNVVTASGNLSAGNLITGGVVSANGNITGGNLVTAGNVQAENIVNITANTSIGMGNGSGIVAITSSGNQTQFAPSGQITLGGASQIVGGTFGGSGLTLGTSQTDIFQSRGGNVTVQVGASGTIANTWTFAQDGSFTSPGTVSATGNVSGSNLTTGGLITANGNVTGGNVNTAGKVVASSLESNVATGTAPIVVASTTKVPNLNADLLDGYETDTTATANTVVVRNSDGNITGNNISGTLSTAAQPNITSVGTLSSLDVTGNLTTSANLVTDLIVGKTSSITITATGSNQNVNLTPTGTGTVNVGNFIISNVGAPLASTDAATKQYVDDVAQGLHTHDSCNAATQTTLATISGGTVTYDNGTSGVGATLTTTGSYTTIDGVTLTNGMRILVKNEATSANNGIYDVTSSTVLTRSSDFDTPTEMAGGDFTFVTAGTLYDNTGWVMTDTVTTVGTSPVVWTQFSGAGTYTAGTGLTLTGTQFSISNTAVTAGSYGNGDSVASFTVNGQGQLSAAANVAITANAANLSGTTLNSTVVTSSLTSVGTLGSLAVTGNISAGNVSATTFTGALSGAATTAGTVTTAAQPNITSVGTLTSLGISGTITSSAATCLSTTVSGTNSANLIYGNMGDNDQFRILVGATATNAGYVEIATADDGTEPIYVRQYNGVFTSLARTATLLDGSGNTSFPGSVTAGGFVQTTSLTTGASATAGTITGNWSLSGGSRLNATYADLAEKYVADADYEPGTILIFGGNEEVTISTESDSFRVAGVVTTNPAYTMNNECEGEHVATIALQGRVPAKVIGPVFKGDLLVSCSNGYAVANNIARAGTIIGKSLENFTDSSGIIEVAVGRF